MDLSQRQILPMTIADVAHFVFVDFENVPHVDLPAVHGKPVLVTLLVGKAQKKLDLVLVQQIHRHAAQVKIVEVGASGRNALDLTLAYHLGCAIQQSPTAQFYIVSKDQDFDPLISHLDGHARVSRCATFAALPFLPQPLMHPALEQKTREPAPDELAKLILHLQTKTKARPTRRKTLQTHINHVYGHVLSEAELDGTINELIAREIIKIDGRNRISY